MNKNFQSVSIDWAKVSKEYNHQAFDNIKDIEDSVFLYKTPLTLVLNWLKDFVPQDSRNFDQNSLQQGTNNIFSIVGERGAGKSSFIGTLRDSIENNIIFDNNQQDKKIYCFPTLDPTLFAGKIKLIESLLATMKNKVDQASKENISSSFMDRSIHEKAKFDKKIKAMVKLLQDMRIEKSSYAENKTRVEALDNLQNQLEFRKSVTELIDCYLKVINTLRETNYSHICLFIDDLDLVPNKIAYDTLQDIFKFLQYQKRVVLFLAYREEQLINSVVANLLVDNQAILEYQADFNSRSETIKVPFITSEEIKEQATNTLEKGLPRAQRVYLKISQQTKIKEVLGPFICKGNQDVDVFGDQTISAFIRKEVIKQTRLSIEPMDKMEMTNLVYPQQLRGLLQYLEIIHNFHSFELADNPNQNLQKAIPLLRKNINMFKYFLISRFRDSLNKRYMNIVDLWLERDYSSKNGLIVVSLLDLVKENGVDLTNVEENIYFKSSNNVTLGNVFSALESFKHTYYGDVQALNFLYTIKLLYSIENLSLLTKSLKKFCESKLVTSFYDERENIEVDFNLSTIISSSNSNLEKHFETIEPIEKIIEEIGLDRYFMLVRGKVMPDTFYYNDEVNGDYTITNFNLYHIQRLFFSNISAQGFIKKFGEVDPVYNPSEKYYAYKYRNFFEKDSFVKGRQYMVDPFASLTDASYVLEVFHRIHHKEELTDYLFYNLFDLDYFVRKNFTRQSQTELFEYTLRRVNSIFDGELNTRDEIDLRRNMSIPLMVSYDEANLAFKPLIEIGKLDVPNEPEAPQDASAQIIQDFVRNRYKDETLYGLSANEIKKFLKHYWNFFKEWPTTMTDKEIERATSLMIPGNKYQISKAEKSYLKKIVERLKEEGIY